MRLIDGDDLWERLDNEPWFDNADRDEIALPIVSAAPTVDAEVVVRCKDCKYRTEFGNCGHLRHHGILPTAYPYDFCSYGERKDGGAENGNARVG